ncbi:MAG: hypothetical protein KDB22_25090 [Planctomycetales bacterium]|nr:hypothetical protein [Planctomycetales bacterium]
MTKQPKRIRVYAVSYYVDGMKVWWHESMSRDAALAFAAELKKDSRKPTVHCFYFDPARLRESANRVKEIETAVSES